MSEVAVVGSLWFPVQPSLLKLKTLHTFKPAVQLLGNLNLQQNKIQLAEYQFLLLPVSHYRIDVIKVC